MIDDLLNNENWWWLFYLLTPVAALLCVKASMALGARFEHAFGHIQKSQASTSSKAMMALTGFLLAISFNIADRTFNERKWLVLNEANVVTTTFLRSYFLPEEHRVPF